MNWQSYNFRDIFTENLAVDNIRYYYDVMIESAHRYKGCDNLYVDYCLDLNPGTLLKILTIT